jgi:hypothetical protein
MWSTDDGGRRDRRTFDAGGVFYTSFWKVKKDIGVIRKRGPLEFDLVSALLSTASTELGQTVLLQS